MLQNPSAQAQSMDYALTDPHHLGTVKAPKIPDERVYICPEIETDIRTGFHQTSASSLAGLERPMRRLQSLPGPRNTLAGGLYVIKTPIKNTR